MRCWFGQGLARIHGKMREALAQEGAAVDGILVACDVAGKPTGRRKPAPGMLLEAMAHFGVTPCHLLFTDSMCLDTQRIRNPVEAGSQSMAYRAFWSTPKPQSTHGR